MTDDRETQRLKQKEWGHFSSPVSKPNNSDASLLTGSDEDDDFVLIFCLQVRELPDSESFVVQANSLIIPLSLVYVSRQAATKK